MKKLKSLVRDIIEPSRSLGHIDRANAKNAGAKSDQSTSVLVATSTKDSQVSTTRDMTVNKGKDNGLAVRGQEVCEDC